MVTSVPLTYANFNMNDGQNYFVLEKPFSMVPVKESLLKVARNPGVKRTGAVQNERNLTVKVRIVGTSRSNLEQLIDSLLLAMQPQQQQLKTHSLDSRYFTCDCIDFQTQLVPGQILWCDAQITFLAQYPYAYAASTSTFTTGMTTLTSQGGGVYAFPAISFSGGGTAIAPPTITLVNGTALAWSGLTITQSTDNQVFSMSTGLPSALNDTLTIICDPTLSNGYSVTLNGGSPLAFTGSFPYLEAYPTSWAITINASSAPHCNATWSWTARYAS